jgi:hypothetical protein
VAEAQQFALYALVAQPGLSRAIRSTRVTMAGSIGGRPGRFEKVQCRATSRRCQARTVAGVTSRCLLNARGEEPDQGREDGAVGPVH